MNSSELISKTVMAINTEPLQHWDEFKKVAFKPPYPDLRKVRGWIRSGDIQGRIIGKDVYIYADRFYSKNPKSVHEQAMELLGG